MQFPGCLAVVLQGLVQAGLNIGQALIDAAGTLQSLFQVLQDASQLFRLNPVLPGQVVLGAQFLFDIGKAFRTEVHPGHCSLETAACFFTIDCCLAEQLYRFIDVRIE